MSKTLNKIQTIAKVAYILSRIAMVFAIVAVCLCAVGGISVLIAKDVLFKVGDLNIKGLVKIEEDMDTGLMFYIMFKSAAISVSEAVVAGFAARYCKNELAAGTPFTFEGAKEMRRLGIIAAVVPLACVMVSEVVGTVAGKLNDAVYNVDISVDGTLIGGILLIGVSLILQYGTELVQGEKTQN